MKIAYVVSQFPQLSETFVAREILAMAERGSDVLIFSLKKPASTTRSHDEFRLLLRKTVYSAFLSIAVIHSQFHFLLRRPSIYLKLFFAIAWNNRHSPPTFLKHLATFPKMVHFAHVVEKEKFHHIHAHFANIPAYTAHVMAELCGVSYSFMAHAWDIYLGASRPALVQCMTRAKFVVTATDYNRRQLQEILKNRGNANIHVLRTGLDLKKFPPRISTDFNPTILSVGRLTAKKGYSVLVAACKKLSDDGIAFVCDIIGDGEERPRVASLIRTYSLESKVKLLGEMTQEQMTGYFQTAGCFVLPCVITPDGDRDGLPNSLLEAMAMGVPTISTAIVGIPELIRDGETGLLAESGNSESLSEAIKKVFFDPSLRQRLIANARTEIETYYSIGCIAYKLEELIRQ